MPTLTTSAQPFPFAKADEKSFCARGRDSHSELGFPLEKRSVSPGSALSCSARA